MTVLMSMRGLLTCSLLVLVLAGLVVALTRGDPAHAGSPTAITFDDLGVPPNVTVNTQYAGQGVTFNNVMAISYPAGFAHSGTVAIEQCLGVEFCSSPIAASFTSGQQDVSIWVGFSFPLNAPLTVRLTAFDASHVSVGTDEVTFPANPGVTPIQTQLSVTTASATIRSIEIGVPGGFTNAVAADDLEFSTAGPAPPCDANEVPTVDVTQPPVDSTVQNNEFLLQGSVATGGASIESAHILNDSQQGSRKATLYPTLIPSTGGSFGPIRFGSFLSPGENKLLVTATNCLGTGVSRQFVVRLLPVPSSASFRLLGLEVTQGVQLEVTQGVQTAENRVPLIAAAANSHKRTFVRVYLGLSGASRISNVSGRLTASRPDGSLPGGPATVASLNSITVDSTTTRASARRSLDTSLNFELPREWLAAGQLHLQLDHLEIEGAQSGLPCIDCNNPGVDPLPGQPAQGPALVRFHTVPPLRVWLIGIPYMKGASTQVMPRQLDFDMLASWLRRAYPTADVQITQTNLAALASPPASCHVVNAALANFVALLPAQPPQTRYYGLIPDNSKQNFVGACVEHIGGQFGSGSAGAVFPEDDPWDEDGSYADAYGAHEIAHMYGRMHPGFCPGQDRDDPNYPYLNGSIGGFLGTSIVDVQGLDAGDASLGLPLALYDWREGWHDLMSYCRFQWMSDYTYRGILQNLCEEDQANCPDHALLGVRARRPDEAARDPLGGRAVSITGTITLATGKVALGPLWARNGLRPTEPEPGSPYAIELRNAKGRVLERHPFQPPEQSDSPGRGGARALIHEVVAFPAATKRIVILRGSQTLASRNVSAHAPKVRLLAPNGGNELEDQVRVRWRSSDADRNRRWYTLLYTPDGRTFIPVATNVTRTSLRVDLTTLPGGTRARFEVIATDGVRTASDRSDRTFTVPVKPPRVSIAAPGDETEVVEGQPITFVGNAFDLQDGPLVPSQLEWRSSLQGVLGSGPTVTPSLQPGTHVITLVGTNDAGESASATVTVTVAAVPPLVVAELVP
jgi:hypothetical protein